MPYDELINPLAINLTAVNTFILICSSVTMVLALAAIQEGNKPKVPGVPAGHRPDRSRLPGVQIYEYYKLMVGQHYPPGISATGHFRPSVSLFASCFFTMTGFHGLHVTGGVILLIGHLHPIASSARTRRPITPRSSSPGSTGTSSTWSGSSSSRSFTCFERIAARTAVRVAFGPSERTPRMAETQSSLRI